MTSRKHRESWLSLSNVSSSIEHLTIWRHAGKLTLLLLATSFLLLLILRAIPQIDIAVSAAFFDQMKCGLGPNAPGLNKFSPRCGKFLFAQNELLDWIRMGIWWFISLLVACVFLRLLWLIWKRPGGLLDRIVAPLVSLISYLVGPAFIANIILKEHWGRPRPATTFDFGSKLPYVKPGDISMHCDTNCSFVSGEATAAFWLFSLVLFLPQKYRMLGSASIACIAIYVSLSRIMFGAHYFSDIVMSGMVALTSIIFACWFVQTRLVSVRLTKLFG